MNMVGYNTQVAGGTLSVYYSALKNDGTTKLTVQPVIGDFVCYDPDATSRTADVNYPGLPPNYTGTAAAPNASGLVVTRPETALLACGAGVVTSVTPIASNNTSIAYHAWLMIDTTGYLLANTKSNMTKYVTGLGPADGSFALQTITTSIASGAANLAYLSLVVAMACETVDTSSTAAIKRVRLGVLGGLPLTS